MSRPTEHVDTRNKRIAINTLMLYFRMLLTMGVSLYTVRVVLNTLGVEDYGIYNVVGGVVALLAFLPSAMASASQRFFSHALGQADSGRLNQVFGVNVLIYAGMSMVAILALETVGLWFVSGHLAVPDERHRAAVQLYHLAIVTFTLGIFKASFMAIIIAHEDMKIYAYVAISEALLKLGSVLALVVLPGDKIVIYGALILAVAFVNTATYIIICSRRYSECRLRNVRWEGGLAREIVGFTGWTLFGQLTTVARTQAITVLLNQFFNPTVVAARAIAMTVATQSTMLAQNFNLGLYPPIIKAYAADQKDEMLSLIFSGSKITFFLMWLVALPMLLEMEAILNLWLKEPPPYATLFARLALIEVLINSVSNPLMTAARAPGRMGLYEGTLGTLQIGIFAASWMALRAGGGPSSVFFVAIAINVLMLFVRLLIVRHLIGISVLTFLRRVIAPVMMVGVLSAGVCLVFQSFLLGGLLYSAAVILGGSAFNAVVIYFLGLDRAWREKIHSVVRARFGRILFG